MVFFRLPLRFVVWTGKVNNDNDSSNKTETKNSLLVLFKKKKKKPFVKRQLCKGLWKQPHRLPTRGGLCREREAGVKKTNSGRSDTARAGGVCSPAFFAPLLAFWKGWREGGEGKGLNQQEATVFRPWQTALLLTSLSLPPSLPPAWGPGLE